MISFWNGDCPWKFLKVPSVSNIPTGLICSCDSRDTGENVSRQIYSNVHAKKNGFIVEVAFLVFYEKIFLENFAKYSGERIW